MEVFVPIKGFEGYFEVSNYGKIRGVPRKFCPNSRIMRTHVDAGGYVAVHLQKRQQKKTLKVHRILAIAFIPNPNNYNTINHINGIKTDNSLPNLEWCTQADNMKHAYRLGLNRVVRGEETGSAILTEKQVVQIREIRKTGLTYLKIGEHFNVSGQVVGDICRGKIWKHV